MLQRRVEDEDEEFFRRFVLCEEDRLKRHPTTVWTGGYRWFRSGNVIPIERYRAPEEINRIRTNLLRRYLQFVGLYGRACQAMEIDPDTTPIPVDATVSSGRCADYARRQR